MDVPQGLHEGSIHLDVATGDGEVLQERIVIYRAQDRKKYNASEVGLYVT